MRRRFDPTEFDAHNAVIRMRLQHLLRSGQTTLYERQYTYQPLKQSEMPVVRDHMFQILKELDPIGVAGRRPHLGTRPRGAYHVPGPNNVWSIDGHHKLSMFGIEIYAGIDAFSRYLLPDSPFSQSLIRLWQVMYSSDWWCMILGIYTTARYHFNVLAFTPSWIRLAGTVRPRCCIGQVGKILLMVNKNWNRSQSTSLYTSIGLAAYKEQLVIGGVYGLILVSNNLHNSASKGSLFVN